MTTAYGEMPGVAPMYDAPPNWRLDAACRGMDPEKAMSIFFPAPSGPGQYDAARVICGGCPVRAECLDDALVYGLAWHDDGFRGGKTPRERAKLRGRKIPLKARACGVCGHKFTGSRVAFYCSPACRRAAHAERVRKGRAL